MKYFVIILVYNKTRFQKQPPKQFSKISVLFFQEQPFYNFPGRLICSSNRHKFSRRAYRKDFSLRRFYDRLSSFSYFERAKSQDIRHTTYENSWQWTMSYVRDVFRTFMLTFILMKKSKNIIEAAKGQGGEGVRNLTTAKMIYFIFFRKTSEKKLAKMPRK